MTHTTRNPDHQHRGQSKRHWLLSKVSIATVVALGILGFLVYKGHGTHLLGFAPYLLILACPLMHLFMHGHHRHGDDHGSHTPSRPDSSASGSDNR